MRRQLLPGGHLPVQHTGERVRRLVRRVFLRGRFAPFAVPLNVTDGSWRSPGRKAGNGYESGKEYGGMMGEWGTVILIAVVVLVFLFAGGGGG
jgi:hypothetical protein